MLQEMPVADTDIPAVQGQCKPFDDLDEGIQQKAVGLTVRYYKWNKQAFSSAVGRSGN